MKIIKASFNWGRWIWDCPDCNASNIISPGQTMAICGECYPDKMAKKQTIINNVVVDGLDHKKQTDAKRQAFGENRVYKIRYPKSHKKIVEALRYRKTEHMCWEPGETVEDLLEENKSHPDLKYMESKPLDAPVKKISNKRLPEIDEKTLRRIF